MCDYARGLGLGNMECNWGSDIDVHTMKQLPVRSVSDGQRSFVLIYVVILCYVAPNQFTVPRIRTPLGAGC